MFLAVDLGTTSWKAALIRSGGEHVRLARIPTPLADENGHPCYCAADIGVNLGRLLSLLPAEALAHVRLVTLTGMAEAGLIVDANSLEPRSNVWPWFDRRAIPVFEAARRDPRFASRASVTGLPDSYKYGIYKLLTLLLDRRYRLKEIKWMGLVAYAGSLLTGECAEDISIAARTGCVDLHARSWDQAFLSSLGLSADNFPRLTPQGESIGTVQAPMYGLPQGVRVCLGGHDHVCAAYAAGALEQNGVFLSTGTAQVVLGTAPETETASGLSYGPSPAGLPYTCLGSIQSAGGSVNFWRNKLYPGEDFSTLLREVQEAPAPSGLMYYPYLAGSGAPHLDPSACGALLGLRDGTSRAAIIAGVYEGLALETRYLTETMGIRVPSVLCCMGGLTRHPRYMQTLADVLGMTVSIPAVDEGTLYGAARLAVHQLGLPPLPALPTAAVYQPNPTAHQHWQHIYEARYLPLMKITKEEVQ